MKTYSISEIIITLKNKNISLFTISDFSRLFFLKNTNTLYKKIQRLEKQKIIKKLINGKYLFSLSPIDEFSTAHFILNPSYISLESALSFYGIMTGFSYSITSITTRPTKTVEIDGKEYLYSHISPSLFWGYEKNGQFLIAEREKALLDYCYFSLKGLRTPIDFEEIDKTQLNKKKLLEYAHRLQDRRIKKII
jgi:predicted transcriptional regulator of viral defense system